MPLQQNAKMRHPVLTAAAGLRRRVRVAGTVTLGRARVESARTIGPTVESARAIGPTVESARAISPDSVRVGRYPLAAPGPGSSRPGPSGHSPVWPGWESSGRQSKLPCACPIRCALDLSI